MKRTTVSADLIAARLLRLARIHRELFPRRSTDGLEPADAQVLIAVWRDPTADVRTIAEAAGLNRPSASNALRTLTDLGYIEQSIDPQDARRRNRALTSSGRRTVRKILARAQQAFDQSPL